MHVSGHVPPYGWMWVRLSVTIQLMIGHELDKRLHLNQMQAMRSSWVACRYIAKWDEKDKNELRGLDQIDCPPFMNHLGYLSPIPNTI